MKETLKYNKEIEFDNTISEISSISLECTYNEESRAASGVFLIEGSYKSFELFDEENFRYELPFEEPIANLKENSLNIEINDFTYEIDANKLLVNIDYTVAYEQEENKEDYLDEEELNRFLEEHEVDVISFKDSEENQEIIENPENADEPQEIRYPEEEILAGEEGESEGDTEVIIETNKEPQTDQERLLEETILSSINQEEKYITYHVYVCENDDTLESISKKYNLSINEIIEYNNIEEIKGGIKLILPAKDE